MHHIISSSSLSTPSHVTSNGSTSRVPQYLRLQQDCHLDHVPECVEPSSANDFSAPAGGYLLGTTPVELPSSNVAESGALSIVPIPVPQDPGAQSSRFTHASYPVSTSLTVHPEDDRRPSIINGQRVQLLHGVPVPITQASLPFRSYYPDPPLNTLTPHYNGVAQGRASDHVTYPCIALSSPNTGTMLPHTVGNQYPLGYPQDNRNVSTFGEPSFVHHTTTRPTVGSASPAHGYSLPRCGWADRYGSRHHSTSSPSSNVSLWSAPPNPVVFPLQGRHLSDHLDRGNFPTSLEWTTSPAWSTSQPYLRPNEPTELSRSPVVQPTHSVTFDRTCTHLPHILPYTLPTNSNAQMVDLHASPSVPPSPIPPLPSSGEIYMRNLNQLNESQARGRIRAHHRTKMKGSPRACKSISIRRAGLSETQSRTLVRRSVARPLRYQNVQVCCGWQNEDGRQCGTPVTYNDCADHFSAVHGIIGMAADIKVLCRWCPSSVGKKIKRKNILRHFREKHLHCPRPKQHDS